jgi:hypothetical protein
MPALDAAILLLALLAGAPPTPSPVPPERLLSGRWGGPGVGLQVSTEGARVDFDCAHGTISPPLRIDETGRFRLPGLFVPERPGPARQGRAEDGVPALYTGSTDGKTMSLTVSEQDSDRTFGTYSLTLDTTPRLRRCQ